VGLSTPNCCVSTALYWALGAAIKPGWEKAAVIGAHSSLCKC
jgi:hypothetical protein